MSKSQEKRLTTQLEGASAEELLARIVALEQENFILWDVVGDLMDIRKEDISEQLTRLSGRAESGDPE